MSKKSRVRKILISPSSLQIEADEKFILCGAGEVGGFLVGNKDKNIYFRLVRPYYLLY
ncbi:MAG: hypothetical protein ABFS56_23335 [Pseudomonadota bacterium]